MCEPVSADFPDMQGKYREFPGIWGFLGPLAAYKVPKPLSFPTNFPAYWNRELKPLIREIFSRNKDSKSRFRKSW